MSLVSGSQKGEKKNKNEREKKGASPLNLFKFLSSLSSQRKGCNTSGEKYKINREVCNNDLFS